MSMVSMAALKYIYYLQKILNINLSINYGGFPVRQPISLTITVVFTFFLARNPNNK